MTRKFKLIPEISERTMSICGRSNIECMIFSISLQIEGEDSPRTKLLSISKSTSESKIDFLIRCQLQITPTTIEAIRQKAITYLTDLYKTEIAELEYKYQLKKLNIALIGYTDTTFTFDSNLSQEEQN